MKDTENRRRLVLLRAEWRNLTKGKRAAKTIWATAYTAWEANPNDTTRNAVLHAAGQYALIKDHLDLVLERLQRLEAALLNATRKKRLYHRLHVSA